MSQTSDVSVEPLKWPIAPDGYIPNSVIRSWRRKGKVFRKIDPWDDIIFYSLHQECTANDRKEFSTRILWAIHDDEEEGEIVYDEGKRRNKEMPEEKYEKEEDNSGMKGKEDEKTKKKKKTEELGRQEKPAEKKEREEALPRQFHTAHTKPELQDKNKTFDDRIFEKIPPQRPTFRHENGFKVLSELRDEVQHHEPITPPPQYLSVPKTQRTSSPEEHRIAVHLSPVEPQNGTSHAPTIPEDPQAQPDLGPAECSPIRDKKPLLSSAKYENITNQVQGSLDRKALELFRKYKACMKNSSQQGKLFTPVSKAAQLTIQTSTRDLNEEKPEWRKKPYNLISSQSFYTPQGPKLATAKHPVKPSHAGQSVTSIPPLQPGQVAAHQRVVQKIQMKDTLELSSSHFHYVIPLASQHSFFTLHPCGKTQYGRQQFDWIRGHKENKMLNLDPT